MLALKTLFSDRLLENNNGDEGMSQLSLTIHYSPISVLKELSSGNKWCETPSDIESFRSFIFENEAYKAIKELKPLRVELFWSEI